MHTSTVLPNLANIWGGGHGPPGYSYAYGNAMSSNFTCARLLSQLSRVALLAINALHSPSKQSMYGALN